MIKTSHAAKDYDPYLFIKYGDNDSEVTPSTSATDNIIGVGTNVKALEGKETDVIWQGEAELRLGGTVKAGERLTSDAEGRGIKAEDGNVIKAIAVSDGVLNDIIRVCVV